VHVQDTVNEARTAVGAKLVAAGNLQVILLVGKDIEAKKQYAGTVLDESAT
jgi:hypothetical protein